MNHLFTKVGFPENGEVGEQRTKVVPIRVEKGRFAGRKHEARGSGHKAADTMSEIIQIAAVHEFGAPNKNIPERSFVRSSLDENLQELQIFKKQQAEFVIRGRQTAMVGIAKIGEWLTNKMKLKINSNIPPRLADATIARKGSSKSLIDTAQMLNSVQHTEAYAQ